MRLVASVFKPVLWSSVLTCGVLLALASCGGGKAQPAQTGGANPGSSLPDNPPPPPAQSPESAAGVKAFDAGNYTDARASFEAAVKKNPSDYASFVNLGQTCEKLADVGCAEAAYKGALAAQPDLEQAAAELSTLYSGDGKVDDALTIARSALKAHPGSGPLHTALAIGLATHGDQDPAIQEFNQAIQLTPTDPMLQYTFASYLNQWHVRGAAPHLDMALGLVKDDYAMIVSIGHEYRMAGEFAGCTKALDRAIGMKDGGEARTERALCKLGNKDEAGAMTDLQGAIAAETGYAPAHYYLAGRLASAKRYKEAAAEYQKYLDLAPSGSLAKNAADRLKMAQDAAVKDKGAVAPPKKK
jgi:tetratricopeptide (TPR) repeat protein